VNVTDQASDQDRTIESTNKSGGNNSVRLGSGQSGHVSAGVRGVYDNEARMFFDNLKPPTKIERFAQAWDAERGHVIFGCGDGERSALIHGDGDGFDFNPCRTGITRYPKDAHYRETIDGRELFKQIRQLVTEYVHFKDPRVATLVTGWIMGTYLYTAFTHFGYLFFYSKLPRSGKSRLLEIISHLAFEATLPLNAPTAATIREMASVGKSLLFDTIERWKGKSPEAFHAMMELLDAGFRNGGTVTKMVRRDNDWRQEMYPVYAPYALAAIGRDSLSETALDRAFPIEMQRKSSHDHVKRYKDHAFEAIAVALRESLYAWALQSGRAVYDIYTGDTFETRTKQLRLNDRGEDIWRPILAIAQAVGLDEGHDLENLARTLHEDPEAEDDRQKLAIVEILLSRVKEGQTIGTSTELSGGLDLGGTELHRILTSWGFKQEKRWIDGTSSRVWILAEPRLRVLAAELSRGLSGEPASAAESVSTFLPVQNRDQSDQTSALVHKSGGESTFSPSHGNSDPANARDQDPDSSDQTSALVTLSGSSRQARFSRQTLQTQEEKSAAENDRLFKLYNQGVAQLLAKDRDFQDLFGKLSQVRNTVRVRFGDD
jgi:hypothetical protein